MDNTVKFALSDIQYYQNDDSVEFAIARLAVLSTKRNSHRLNITKEILKRDGVSVLGKWIIADYDGFDVTTHTDNVHIVGVVPHDAKIDFIDNDDGTVTMWVDAVISKLYATQVYELFKNKNFRNVSVEMTTKNNTEQIDGSISIDGFTIYAICILGQHVNGSCPDAHMEMVRFSQEEADNYYHNTFSQIKQMEKLAEVSKRYKIDKSAKAMSNDDWSNVDKTKLRNTILNAQNKSTLVKAVYLKVESNWEDTPSERLGYPVMQLKGDTFVYNRNALANAKARATQQNETEVLRKLGAIYNKLNLKEETENKEEAEEKMAKLEEEKKNVVMEQPTEEAPKEDEKKLAEDADKKEEEKEEVKDKKASDNSDSDKKDDDKKEEKEKASDDSDKKEEDKEEVKDKKASDNSDSDKKDDDKKEEKEKASDDSDKKEEDKEEDDDKLSEAKAQCADLEAKCAKLEAKLSELEKFKADTEEKEKMAIVNQTLAQVKESMDSDTYAKFEEKAKEQTLDTVNAWRNEVLANVATVLMSAKKDESHLRMDIEEDSKTPTSLWDRM